MGAVQSVIPTEAVTAGALVAGTATAYAVYRRVAGADAQDGTASTRTAEEKSTSSTTTSVKKGKGKKRKELTSPAPTNDKSDAELDAIVERAKAERERAQAEAEARRAAAKLVPGAFDDQGAAGTASTAVSSEAEGSKGKARQKKTRKKGKKAIAASGAAAAPASSGTTPDGGRDSSEVTAGGASSSKKSAEGSSKPEPTPLAGTSKKSKKRKGVKAGDAHAAAASSAGTGGSKAMDKSSNPPSLQSSRALGMSVTLSDAPEDASWTRVSTRKKSSHQTQTQNQNQPSEPGTVQTQTDPELLTSDTNLTTSGVTDPENNSEEDGEGEGVQEPGKRRTFAERMLPRPRKTGVEDMEDEPLQPTLARVIRVKPPSGEKPAKGFSWADYEEYAKMDDGTSADGDTDDAWEEVKSKKRSRLDRSTSALTSSADSLSFSQASHVSPATSQAAPTKRQRQNVERREAEKRARDAAERDRLERLAKHRKELERTRIEEQYAKSGSGSNKKNVSGGMKASVEGGKLVWD